MVESLKLHPASRCDAVKEIAAEVVRSRNGVLTLLYSITGDIGALRLPEPEPAARADELWRHTCFEAFVRADSDVGYVELNFAPSRQWAAYRFDSYRDGMRPLRDMAPPAIEIRREEDSLDLEAVIDLGQIVSPEAVWRLGLSTVIEQNNARHSYWALTHPPGKPDFHHKDCFKLELASPS